MRDEYDYDKPNEALEKVGLQLDLAIKNGFDCHVCSCTGFTYNGMGLVWCRECAVTYHIDALDKIYNK